MDRSYEGAPTRELAERLGFKPVVLPSKNRTSNPGSMIGRCIKNVMK